MSEDFQPQEFQLQSLSLALQMEPVIILRLLRQMPLEPALRQQQVILLPRQPHQVAEAEAEAEGVVVDLQAHLPHHLQPVKNSLVQT